MALYNGNISETYWKSSSDNVLRKYGYSYDGLNRLNASLYMKPMTSQQRGMDLGSYNEHITYDKNGNINTLFRNGDLDSNLDVIEIDDLDYVYDGGNKLLKVMDNSNHPEGFKDGANSGNDYVYDDFGNMIQDLNKGINSITYNHLNLPKKITYSTSSQNISYLYNALGVKVQKKVYREGQTTPFNQPPYTITTDYLGGFHYEFHDNPNLIGNNGMVFFATNEGYVNVTLGKFGNPTYNYVYNYTDHLGNIRVSYTSGTGGAATIMEENHYYPFGLKHKKYGSTVKDLVEVEDGEDYYVGIEIVPPGARKTYQYKYNGKEFQDELGLNLYDYGARFYMPDIVRWGQIDPLAEKGRRWSPYVYAFNSPVFFIDPDGMWPDPPFGFSASLNISFGSNGLSFKANASMGVGMGGSNLQGVGFAGISVYAGNQIGTSSMARGIQFDATIGAYATLGSGSGNSHIVNTLNPDTPSGITNDFRTSFTYGQMLTYSSAINAERGLNDGGAVQRLGMVGFKAFGDLSFITSNDTGTIGGGGTDKGQTGNGTLNLGGDRGFSLSYMNYTGSYNRDYEDSIKYGSYYPQTPYQQSLNQSAFRIDSQGVYLIGGTSNGSIQNAIHSVTNTGLFTYPNTTTDTSNLFNLFYNR